MAQLTKKPPAPAASENNKDVDLVEATGHLLDGDRWQSAMARRMNWSIRHLAFIKSGERPVPGGVIERLINHADMRVKELMDLRQTLVERARKSRV